MIKNSLLFETQSAQFRSKKVLLETFKNSKILLLLHF